MLGYLPTWAIYFAVYDGIKTYFGEEPLGSTKHSDEDTRLWPAAQPKGYQPLVREHPWGLHILSAMTAGAASTCVTNPLWVIKTRFMVRTRPYYILRKALIMTIQTDSTSFGNPISQYTRCILYALSN